MLVHVDMKTGSDPHELSTSGLIRQGHHPMSAVAMWRLSRLSPRVRVLLAPSDGHRTRRLSGFYPRALRDFGRLSPRVPPSAGPQLTTHRPIGITRHHHGACAVAFWPAPNANRTLTRRKACGQYKSRKRRTPNAIGHWYYPPGISDRDKTGITLPLWLGRPRC